MTSVTGVAASILWWSNGSATTRETMTTAVLLSCHGTVENLEDLSGFLTNIRRGRPAPAELIDEVRHRYEKIGGSPLMKTTRSVAVALEKRLGLPVRSAGRLWHPYPVDVLRALKEEHPIKRIVSLPLAPQSVHVYHPQVEEACVELELEFVKAPSWGLNPRLVDTFSSHIQDARSRFGATDRVGVVLSAHSLPLRILKMGDPYEKDFRAMAAAVAKNIAGEVAAADDIVVAFQSQGMSGGDWLGPDLAETFAACKARGLEHLVVAPIGFLAEHVETLYDIDIEAKGIADEAGIQRIERMPALDVDAGLIDALAEVAAPLLG